MPPGLQAQLPGIGGVAACRFRFQEEVRDENSPPRPHSPIGTKFSHTRPRPRSRLRAWIDSSPIGMKPPRPRPGQRSTHPRYIQPERQTTKGRRVEEESSDLTSCRS